jgi:hypothetical protein
MELQTLCVRSGEPQSAASRVEEAGARELGGVDVVVALSILAGSRCNLAAF